MVNPVLDTNLLILFLLGSYKPNMISGCTYTSKFNKDDFDLLNEFIKNQSAICITPEIIAELSNQSFFLMEPGLSEYFKVIINKLSGMKEKYIPLTELLKNVDLLHKIGFTDISIYELAKNKDFVILTDDLKLYGFITSQKLNALNWSNIQAKAWNL